VTSPHDLLAAAIHECHEPGTPVCVDCRYESVGYFATEPGQTLLARIGEAEALVASFRKHLAEDHPECPWTVLGILAPDAGPQG
jgi:hypothetical protein